jgi:prophage regulatory protein
MPTDRHTTAVAQTERGLGLQQSRQNASASKLLRLPAVTARVGMRRTSIYALIKAGKFPSPVKIGKASAWVDDEITQWIEELKIERTAAKG